jgi:D-alanine-D-alanine ligase
MARRKLRVAMMVHEDLQPPETLDGLDPKDAELLMTEFDVRDGLRKLGHEVHVIGLHDELAPLRRLIREIEPHVVFNLLEAFHGESVYDQHVVAYLELLRQAYTGCNPRGLTLGRDKALSKKILHYHRIRVPGFRVFPRHAPIRKEPSRQLRKGDFPLIVKSLVEEGSHGISEASVVHNDAKLRERIEFIHDSIGTDAIVEEFIDGREIYSAALGNHVVTVLPTWELRIENLRADAPLVATRRVKWDTAFQERRGVEIGAAVLDDAVVADVRRTTKRIYRLLGLTGYARIDFRLDATGRLYFLEANPNPDIGLGQEFPGAAEAAGLDYEEMLHKILNLGLQAARRRPG